MPDGGPDNNVFDIEQGVTIGLFVKAPGQDGPAGKVFHASLWGERERKYDCLDQSDIRRPTGQRSRRNRRFISLYPRT